MELELFLFTSKNVTNIWAGIGDRQVGRIGNIAPRHAIAHHEIQGWGNVAIGGEGHRLPTGYCVLPAAYCRLL